MAVQAAQDDTKHGPVMDAGSDDPFTNGIDRAASSGAWTATPFIVLGSRSPMHPLSAVRAQPHLGMFTEADQLSLVE